MPIYCDHEFGRVPTSRADERDDRRSCLQLLQSYGRIGDCDSMMCCVSQQRRGRRTKTLFEKKQNFGASKADPWSL